MQSQDERCHSTTCLWQAVAIVVVGRAMQRAIS